MHCGEGFRWAGRWSTLCGPCEDLGHIPKHQGKCILCQMKREVAMSESADIATGDTVGS